jgi:hypothetical protein
LRPLFGLKFELTSDEKNRKNSASRVDSREQRDAA